jgi:hypothetical protein
LSNLTVAFLNELRAAYSLECFVETGCFQGDGIATAITAGFRLVRSCDIGPEYVARCRQRFTGCPNVLIAESESISALTRQLLEPLPPCLFWLDAHYPAFYGSAETEQTKVPVLEELSLIRRLRRGAPNDVILIDDIRTYNTPDNPRWNPEEVHDYYRVTGITLADVTNQFAKTHEFRLLHEQEGILAMLPAN